MKLHRISQGVNKIPLALLMLTASGSDIGKPAPDFSLKDASGATVKLSAYKGKPVLLDFWATECGGCKIEIPWFMEFAHSYKDLTVIGVSMDILYEDLRDAKEAWRRVKPFIALHQLNYPILMGDDRVTKIYGVDSLPMTLLIDRTGKIAQVHVGLPKGGKEEFRQEIEAALAR